MMGKRRPGALPILVARFFFCFMDVGLAKSFGILVPDLEEQLETSSAVIGLVTSLSLAAMYLGSPLAKLVIHHCAHRRVVTSMSGLVAGCALIGTAFTRNIVVLSCLFFIMGLCCSVINLQAILLLFEYFQEDYPFASCISILGIPVGAAILPPVTKKLLDAYGVSGTLLVIGAMILNMFPIGILLKERRPQKRDYSKVDTNPPDGDEDSKGIHVTRCNAVSDYGIEMAASKREVYRPAEDVAACNGCKEQCQNGSSVMEIQPLQEKSPHESLPAGHHTRTSTGDHRKLSMCHSPVEVLAQAVSLGSIACESSPSTNALEMTSKGPIRACLTRCHLWVLVEEPLYSVLYLPTIILLFIVTGGWALFLVLYAVEHGIDLSRAAFLPTCGAIGGIIGSVVMSAILRFKPRWSPHLYLTSLVITALCLFLQTLCSSYVYLLVMSFFIGLGVFGANVVVEAVLVMTVLPKNFNDAGSLFLFTIGFGYLLSGYLAGFVRDATDDIEVTFLFLGGLTVVACLLLVILMFCLRRRANSQSDLQTQVEDVGQRNEHHA